MTAATTFDAAAYKATTRAQWDDAADAWHRWGPTLERWLGPATEAMLDAAGVTAGARVLDVAAGAGGQTLTAARRVGSEGHVLATDISPEILARAERVAQSAGGFLGLGSKIPASERDELEKIDEAFEILH